jgi:membrane-bound lytic murein transglycosylase D
MKRTILASLTFAFALLLVSCPWGFCANAPHSRPTADLRGIAALDDEAQADNVENTLPDNLLPGGAPQPPVQARGAGGDAPGTAQAGNGGLTEEEKKIVERVRESLAASGRSDGLDIPVVLNDAVNLYIRYFTETKRTVFARWLVRAKQYAPTIRSILKANGLPEDLAYLAMIESGFNMKAYSPAKAKGPWQFVHETGARYGLRVGFWVDERCDLEKSTVAAARYLKELFDRFGCWYLAAAGYNAGEHRIEKAIEKHDTRDFWKLRRYKTLPRETQEYVPQLIAAALIAKDPVKYGFTQETSHTVATLAKVEVPGGLPLRRIAHALSMDPGELVALNPELVRGITPPGGKPYMITLPGAQDSNVVEKKIEEEFEDGGQVVGVVKYNVRKKESLAGVMKRYNVSRADIALVNDGMARPRISALRVIYIPRFASLKGENPSDGAAGEAGIMHDDGDDVITLAQGKTRIRKSGGPKVMKTSLTKRVGHKTDRAGRRKMIKKSGRASKPKRLAACR